MDDTQKQDQIKPDPNQDTSDTWGSVTVPIGSMEGTPVKVTPEINSSKELQEVREHIQPSEQEPQVSEDVKDYIQVKKDFPEIDQTAKQAGVSKSIPDAPDYGNLPTDQNIAHQIVKTADVNKSDPWRALIAIKEFAKGLFGLNQPQEVH